MAVQRAAHGPRPPPPPPPRPRAAPTSGGALRRAGMTAPGVLVGALPGAAFSASVAPGRRGPPRRPGASVLLDHRPAPKPRAGRDATEKAGAARRFRPPDRPDCNPLAMACSTRKAIVQKAAGRTSKELWATIGAALHAFSSEEGANDCNAAGYDPV